METLATDEIIVERALTGDADAFGELVRRWERRIFALTYGMLGREEDARDATQETFLAAFRNLRGFRGAAKAAASRRSTTSRKTPRAALPRHSVTRRRMSRKAGRRHWRCDAR